MAVVLKNGDLVILESTSPVGATEKLADWLADARPDLNFPKKVGEQADVSVAYCPERVLPGHIMRELVKNDRIIGGLTSRCSERAAELYKTFVEGECVVTDARTAEMAKLTENSCRDVQIAFANELSVICDELDINVWELIKLANRHPRVNILQPGPGVGGHCIAVDPWFIVSKTPKISKLIHTARIVNNAKPRWVLEKVKSAIFELLQEIPNQSVSEITVACFGLAFKPDIDDLRESPSLSIVRELAKIHRGRLIVFAPKIKTLPKKESFELVDFRYASENADIVVVLVDHKEFKVRPELRAKKIIDTKGIW